jgi:hypothetical protein
MLRGFFENDRRRLASSAKYHGLLLVADGKKSSTRSGVRGWIFGSIGVAG